MHGPDTGYYARVATWNQTSKYRDEVDELWRRLAPGTSARVIDVGSGNGGLVRALPPGAARFTGVERAVGWIRSAAESRVVRGDAATLPFPDDSFDTAVLMHVMAHLEKPEQSLAEIHRVLRPGGKVGIVTPNRLHLFALRFRINRVEDWSPDPTVESHFGTRRLRRLVVEAGFEIVDLFRRGPGAGGLPFEPLRERIFAIARKPTGASQSPPRTNKDGVAVVRAAKSCKHHDSRAHRPRHEAGLG